MHTHARTNIVIDEDLMRETLAVTGIRTKREAVDRGLRMLLRMSRQGEVRKLRGAIQWTGDLDAMRTDDDAR